MKNVCEVAILCRNQLPKRLLRILKITALILLLGCLQVSAEGYSQSITLFEKNAPLEKIFKEIKRQTNYSFLYSSQVIKRSHRIDISVTNSSLEQVLKICFSDQPLTWEI